MSDPIERQDALDVIKRLMGDSELSRTVQTGLHILPSAKPEIVRCKDCKWKQGSECVRFAEVRPFPDDFCSRAERRTDD